MTHAQSRNAIGDALEELVHAKCEESRILDQLDKETSKIFGKPVPLIELIRFMNRVRYPKIPKLKPITQRVRQLNAEAFK